MNRKGVKKPDQPQTESKEVKQEQEKPEESGVKLNDLPELPFELILSYLSLEDLIKSRAVSRKWYNVINSFRTKSLAFSGSPNGFIYPKSHWVSGAFAHNFISSIKFQQFFQTSGLSILANLKLLRLCKLDLNAKNTPAFFAQILNSFGQLEELDLFKIDCSSEQSGDRFELHLNLPMLKSIHFEDLYGIEMLTLDAPRLQKVKLVCFTRVKLVHGESVEKLIIDRLYHMEVNKLKNLKYLYCNELSSSDSTLLSTLEQLNETHLASKNDVSNLFQQKAQYRRSNLKIFLSGCLLNAANDPAIDSLGFDNRGYLRYLAENPSKVSREIPLFCCLLYSAIEAAAPGLEIDLLKRLTDLDCISAHEPVKNVDRFLELLKNLNNIVKLDFNNDQPQQELFDRLPDHCAVQCLEISSLPADSDFLFKLKSLTYLYFRFSIDIEFVLRVLKELPFLTAFDFKYLKKYFTLRIYHDSSNDHSKQFTVWLDGIDKTEVSDVNAAVQWISEKGNRIGS